MASYATPAEVKAYAASLNIAQLTADSGTVANDTMITNVATDQSRLMDGYLMGRYVCPITTPAAVMAVLSVHCCRLTIYALLQGRAIADDSASISTDRDITIAWLKDVALGKTSIPGQTEPTAPEGATGDMVGGSMTKVFGTDEALF